MKVKINYFKPSGKFYTDESVDVPEDAQAWDLHKFLPADRLLDMIAVTEGETPWGYPACVPKRRCQVVWRAGVLQPREAPSDGARCVLPPHTDEVEHQFARKP